MSFRVIPVLLLHNGGVVKSIRFKEYNYIGDPINAVKIFNEKEVDEIVIIDIDATRERRGPNFEQISEIAGEAFMPLAYGGGITCLDEVKKLIYNGVEKIIINKAAHTNSNLITEISKIFGVQSVIVSIDVKKKWLRGDCIFVDNGKKSTADKLEEFARKMEDLGAGEILLNNVDRDGTFLGLDSELIERVASAISIPLIAIGGAKGLNDISVAMRAGASAIAAGSIFVYYGNSTDSVLINYPTQSEILTFCNL